MRVTVTHTIGDLASDLQRVANTGTADCAAVVRKHVKAGERQAVRLARARAGGHGYNYYKRISSEMTGATTGEFGPAGVPKSEFVGVGFRNGTNRDLPDAADKIRPEFYRDVDRMLDGWFWPA